MRGKVAEMTSIPVWSSPVFLKARERPPKFGHDVHHCMLGDPNLRVGDAEGASDVSCTIWMIGALVRGLIIEAQDSSPIAEQLGLGQRPTGAGGDSSSPSKSALYGLVADTFRRNVRAGQDLDAMASMRTLVQRGLPIEEDIVAVHHVAVHDIALVEIDEIGVHILPGRSGDPPPSGTQSWHRGTSRRS